MNGKTSFIVDAKGKKVAVQIPISTYRKLVEAWEELKDIAAYDKARKKPGKLIPFEEVFPNTRSKR